VPSRISSKSILHSLLSTQFIELETFREKSSPDFQLVDPIATKNGSAPKIFTKSGESLFKNRFIGCILILRFAGMAACLWKMSMMSDAEILDATRNTEPFGILSRPKVNQPTNFPHIKTELQVFYF